MSATNLATKPAPHAGGVDELVQLDPDHPGFHDLEYRARRNAIAAAALAYRPGDPAPLVAYTEAEHAVWRAVWAQLEPLHQRLACRSYLAHAPEVTLSREQIPQLRDVNVELRARFGFEMLPVAGLVSAHTFLRYLGDRVFLSTQYIRHHSVPLYTPEPDVVHELVGHAATFADADLVRLNLAFGRAAQRTDDPELMRAIGRLYWYTLEFGAVEEAGVVKAYGAGLLSSFGELERFTREAALRPFDIDAIIRTPYDPTQYQSTIFVAPSFERMLDELQRWVERVAG
jgi:phenylalanine-4-hydroxylase